ncbi:antitoxin VbhA family protein [Bifidobacterium sp. ESL0819]|uniref:antitoxin VbhA family protein n=1 Tax=Bifidobacterium sp. ESL0819 TaxID=3448589 RepID=UPI004041BD38
MDERTRRAIALRDGMHSAELEGGRVTDAFRRDAQDYVDGSIDLQGLLDRLNQRYAMHSSL